MSGSLPAQSQQMYSLQPELNNWTKDSYKRLKSTEDTEREAKQTSTSNRYQLYNKMKAKINSGKPVLRTCQNLLQSV
jgi:paraquat-inducible protein B